MAPHHAADSHHGAPSLPKPPALSLHKSNAPKPAIGAPFKRDLQSAMTHSPTIRVIHIFAPKVIQTDVASFRSTVQKLTGRSKKSQRRAARDAALKSVTDAGLGNSADGFVMAHGGGIPQGPHGPHVGAQGASSSQGAQGQGCFAVVPWDQKEELQRLVGDACGVADLVRCDSVDSATYSLDSGNTFSGDSNVDTSPTDSFSFYPQRETPYSLSEIPAPFFGHPDMHSCFSVAASMPMSSQMLSGSVGVGVGAGGIPEHGLLGLPTSHVMDHHNMSMLGFDVDTVGALPLPLPLSDVAPLGCLNSSSSSGGSLFDLMPRQHCRLSVPQPYQGANFFESI